MFAGVGYECDYKDRYISGGRINLSLECEREALEGKVMVSVQGTYKGDSFEGTSTATSFLPGDGDFVMNSKVNGRRTGPTCAAPAAEGGGNAAEPQPAPPRPLAGQDRTHLRLMPLIPCQRALFDIGEGTAYLDCAKMSPLSRAAIEAGRRGLERKAHPWDVGPSISSMNWRRCAGCSPG